MILTDSNLTNAGEDFIVWVTAEPLCYKLETNIRLYIKDSI